MLIKFFVYTGAAVDDQPADPDARRAIDYFLGEVVLKPERYGGPKVKTRRSTAPILLSGQDWLVSQTCADLPFDHRYAAGAIVFHADDIDIAAWTAGTPALRGVTEALMPDFEDTAFAGIPEDHCPEVLWVAHTDKGRLELNFLFARAVPDHKGKLKAINPKPPVKTATALWDAFRDSWNCREGWADPMAPERKRDLKLPGALISTPARDFEGNATFDIRQELTIEISHQIESGTITCRDDVLHWLKDQGHRIKQHGQRLYLGRMYLAAGPLWSLERAPCICQGNPVARRSL